MRDRVNAHAIGVGVTYLWHGHLLQPSNQI